MNDMTPINPNKQNPYLKGLYAPVAEEVSAQNLEVVGEIPKSLHGGYFRNGPNPASPPAGMHHWFDGDGMLHGVWFENGTARYRNRFVQTQDLSTGGADGMPGIFERSIDVAGRTVNYRDTANTDVIYHNGKLLALWYISGKPVAVDPHTLETIAIENFGGKLPRNVSAHSKVDAVTGELVFFDYALYEPKMWTGTVSADGALTHFQEIALPGPRLPHDMGMTENYTILHDLPVIFSEAAIRNRLWQIHVADQPTRFAVVPRKGGEPKWFEFPTCYIYHVINSWEEETPNGTEVVMAACKMVPNGFEPDPQYGPFAAMADVLALRAQPFIWRMNMQTGEGREEQIDDALSEFPVVDTLKAGRKTKHSYHVIFDDCIEQRFSGLVKYDLETGKSERHYFPKGVFGSEPVFVANDDGEEGHLITFTSDLAGKSEVHIINTSDMSAEPVAKVKLPQRVPLGFHGTWAPAV